MFVVDSVQSKVFDTHKVFDTQISAQAFKENSNAEVVIIKNEWPHVQNSPEGVAKVAAWIDKLLERN